MQSSERLEIHKTTKMKKTIVAFFLVASVLMSTISAKPYHPLLTMIQAKQHASLEQLSTQDQADMIRDLALANQSDDPVSDISACACRLYQPWCCFEE